MLFLALLSVFYLLGILLSVVALSNGCRLKSMKPGHKRALAHLLIPFFWPVVGIVLAYNVLKNN